MYAPFPCISGLVLSFCFFFLLVSSPILGDDSVLYEDGMKNYHQIFLPGVIGPESIAFDCNGKGPYVSVSDGRILKWRGHRLGWTEFSVSSPNRERKLCDGSTDSKMEPKCGRPLGLKFNPTTCDLYVADAYYGLLVVGPGGGVPKQIANSAEGVPFRFTNALDIDSKTGVVYFTDSSIFFQRRDYALAIISADRTGRLLKYDPGSKKVTVLFRGLAVPNGLALSKDNSFILVAESGNMKVIKFPIVGSQVKAPQLFAQLGRFPDNIKRNSDGEFWVALNTARGKIEKLSGPANLQQEIGIQWLVNDPVAIKFSEGGDVIKILNGDGGNALESVSEVEDNKGCLWIGSSMKPYLGYIKT